MKLLVQDFSSEFNIGDKIRVTKGELQGAQGLIQNVDGETIFFKPTNLDGYSDNIQLGRQLMQRHFDKGDAITILEGKYTGETGTINQKIERLGKKAQLPYAIYLVRLDRGQNEIHVKASNIRLRSEQNRDIKKLLEMCKQGEFVARKRDGGGGSTFKVQDLVLFNGGKTYGHVIQVLDECLRVIDDSNQLRRLNPKDVDKRMERNRSAIARDQCNNVL